ncbi:HlyD family type I secretion periplasmic adaptor subunit [Endozoicomonas sp. Mp262]|uniref:HlyD family type I secretion periplasmic adaptor subunit n=1 Tax=Endozoicomonas sp. Mp262 TaxID=2919499 RepID=UPI0021DA0A65
MSRKIIVKYSITLSITLFIGLFVLWASFTNIDIVVKSEGRVTTFTNNKIVEHLEGGILAGMHVMEGQRVDKSSLLFTVQNPTLTENISVKKQRLNGLIARGHRLYAEMNGVDLEDSVEAIAKTNSYYFNELELYQKRKKALQERQSIVKTQVNRESARLEESSQVIHDLNNERAVAQKQLDILSSLLKDGAGSIQNQLQKKMALLKIETRINQSIKQKVVIESELGELKLKQEKLLTDFMEEAQDDYNSTMAEIAQVKEQILASRKRESRKEVKSPVTGVLHKLHVNTLGEVVAPGTVLAEIVPDGVPLMVEARIAPFDRAKVWPGQQVHVRVSAYDYSVFGALSGIIKEVSADTYQQEGVYQNYYRAVIETETPGFDENNLLIPGMTVDVNILAGKRTLLGYLLGPLRETFQFTATET